MCWWRKVLEADIAIIIDIKRNARQHTRKRYCEPCEVERASLHPPMQPLNHWSGERVVQEYDQYAWHMLHAQGYFELQLGP